jgi:hypothetical protein
MVLQVVGGLMPSMFILPNRLFMEISSNPFLDLDRDGFYGDNDLQVNIPSQIGGLPSALRLSDSQDIPNESEVYRNTVHSNALKGLDQNGFSQGSSPPIQLDVTKLLFSPDIEFADVISIGSVCHIPARP